MERSVDSLTYKGSVSDAIVEAQGQKKLFLVYISGEDENSTHLERSTWLDDRVAESVSKYCIFLHLRQGSIDALQFSAIYPQKSVPSITAVGYNGVMLWQHEGYVSAEIFLGSIEKAWTALHFQETAVTLLTAALASNKPEPINSSSQDVAHENSAAMNIASTSAVKSIETLEDRPSNDSKLLGKQKVGEPIDDEKDTGPSLEISSEGIVDDVKIMGEGQTSSESDTMGELMYNAASDVHNPLTCNVVDVSIPRKETLPLEESCIDPSALSHEEASLRVSVSRKEVLALEESCTDTSAVSHGEAAVRDPVSSKFTATVKENVNNEEAELINCSTATKSNDINFNIRMPNGTSLQRRFTITDTLRSVKTFVDENQTGAFGSYDLAVPYPRKVFNEQDMNSVLSELGFATRQALIVAPHRQEPRPQRGMPSSIDSQNSARMTQSADDNSPYFAFVKRVLSYVNPFSYFGGNTHSSNSEPAPSDSYQQYRPGQAIRNPQLAGAETSRQSSSTGESAGETRRRASRPFGSNIHTLRHDEDDLQPRDGNMFWNGNSTQFGGGDDKK